MTGAERVELAFAQVAGELARLPWHWGMTERAWQNLGRSIDEALNPPTHPLFDLVERSTVA